MKRYLFPQDYMADPSVHVFNGKIYIYPSHDYYSGIPEDDWGIHFDMKDYHVLSITGDCCVRISRCQLIGSKAINIVIEERKIDVMSRIAREKLDSGAPKARSTAGNKNIHSFGCKRPT